MACSVGVDMRRELITMRTWFGRRCAEFIVVYGKRLIRKNTLIQKFIEDADEIYFFLQKRILERDAQTILFADCRGGGMEYLKRAPFATCDSLLDFFIEKKTDNFAILFDEFLYPVSANSALPSIFQDYRDRKIRKTNLKNIICGSSISMMESLIGYKSPLYG